MRFSQVIVGFLVTGSVSAMAIPSTGSALSARYTPQLEGLLTTRYEGGSEDEDKKVKRYEGGSEDEDKKVKRYEGGSEDEDKKAKRYEDGTEDEDKKAKRYEGGSEDED